MNIEISPKEYWKKLNWYDAELYIVLLDGYRFPTFKEVQYIDNKFKLFYYGMYKVDNVLANGIWYDDIKSWFKHYEYFIIPVKDL